MQNSRAARSGLIRARIASTTVRPTHIARRLAGGLETARQRRQIEGFLGLLGGKKRAVDGEWILDFLEG